MAEIALQEPAIAAAEPVHAQGQDKPPSGVLVLELLCKALGMDLHAKNPLEAPDVDFLQHMATLPVDFSAVPNGTDVENMRKWIDSTLLHGPLAEARLQCDLKCRQPPVPIDIRNISVSCSDGSGHKFGIRMYVPRIARNEEEAQGMPTILMLHGGGWIHGKPEGDEAFSSYLASELRAVVLGVDYWLAPEHPYPAALDDCCEALEWVGIRFEVLNQTLT
ncbi:alpha/beta hydrolase domain-containing protein [Cladophialophora carrionii]|uniref:Alpha/beta hydrolase domain-containing protein n=1 Tax=Cladophialophora carrionii TaxID=86049 RepID=A0A1C1CW77_9EURO|nr:alpha/beta hydrolase domain-containing protein [Cladophialophora carrionii]